MAPRIVFIRPNAIIYRVRIFLLGGWFMKETWLDPVRTKDIEKYIKRKYKQLRGI